MMELPRVEAYALRWEHIFTCSVLLFMSSSGRGRRHPPGMNGADVKNSIDLTISICLRQNQLQDEEKHGKPRVLNSTMLLENIILFF
jgi:hypothetical protein